MKHIKAAIYKKGFTLTEILVAMVIMGFIFVIISSVQVAVARNNKRILNRGLTALQATGLLKDMKKRIAEATYIDLAPSDVNTTASELIGYRNTRSTSPFVPANSYNPISWFRYCTTEDEGAMYLYTGEGNPPETYDECGEGDPLHHFNISDKWKLETWFRRPDKTPHIIEFDARITSTVDGSSTTYQTSYHSQEIPMFVIDEDEVILTYNGNENTSGAIPEQTVYFKNATATIPSTIYPMKSGYNFGGWSTDPNGAGTTYSLGSTFTITQDTTLYAVWN